MILKQKYFSMISVLFLCMLVISCTKNEVDPPLPPVNVPGLDSLNAVPQYGTPFNNVPDASDAVIYQVNMRTFSKASNLAGVLPRLDSIKALGANIIYLMPVHTVGKLKSINSPYAVIDHTDISKEFGSLEDLRVIVDGAHSRGMAVIMDWVPNYTAWDHKWITQHPDWYERKGEKDKDTITHALNQPWYDVAALKLANRELRAMQIAIMKYWLKAANIDGFRCDYAGNGSEDYWKEIMTSMRAIPGRKLFMMAEGDKSYLYRVGFDVLFGFRFFNRMKDIYEKKQPLQSLDNVNVDDYRFANENQWVVRYTTNHDVNASDGTPQELFGGLKGSIGVFIIAAYMKGVPMIYNGQEVGLDYKLDFPFVKQDIDWTPKPQITEEYKRIIAFRKSSAAVKKGTLTNQSDVNICSFIKELGSEKVMVIVNTKDIATGYSIPLLYQNSTWTDVLKGGSVTLGANIVIPPFSYMVLKK